jgi:hypothetical protein
MATLQRRATSIVWLLTTALWGSTAACGGGAASTVDAAAADGARPDVPVDAGSTRRYRLAATGAQYFLGGGLVLGDADLGRDVDVVSVHQDFYGVPWEAFAADTMLPPAWVATMDDLAARTRATGKEVFLSLAPLDGNRRALAPNVRADGSKDFGWKAACYDLATAPDGARLRQAYARYVGWMVREFQPRWVNVAVELSLFMPCGAAWEGMVDLERDAYAAAKAARADVVAFPSIQIDSLYGRAQGSCPTGMTADQCYDVNYARLARLSRDRFAISTYPYGAAGIKTPADVPSDWFTRAADRGGERLVIAEAGWLSTAATGNLDGTCLTFFDQDAQAQAAYFDRLIAITQTHDVDLITWWSDRDLVPEPVMTSCPCTVDAAWCDVVAAFRATGGADPTAQFYGEAVLKMFGTMGLRTYDGTPREPIFGR